MKNLRRFFSLLAVLVFLAIPVFAQSGSESSVDKGEKTDSALSAAFLEPLYCAGSGENIDVAFSASGKQISSLALEIYDFELASALSKNVPVNYVNLSSEDFERLQFALKKAQTVSLSQAKEILVDENDTQKAKLQHYNLSLPKLGDGIYLLRLYDSQAKMRDSFQIVSVSDIRLACLDSGAASGILWALDSKTGAPLCADKVLGQTYAQNK